MTYEEIARRGGGILRSAKRLGQMEEEELYDRSMARLLEVRGQGTGAVEIKSGYGLDKAGELKMLRVIRRLKEAGLMPVRATYLAAHALPMDYRSDDRRSKYIELVIREILPEVAGEGLADYIDVFCEAVAFRVDEMERILVAADRYGIRPKVHVNQFHALGGVAAAVRMGAVSVDHLEVVSADDVAVLGSAQTIATLLPTAPFFLRDPFPPVRKLIDAGVAVALASDFNPGSSPSGRMPFVVSLACIQMGMYPEEALQAATLNGAFALEWGDHLGSIARGKLANLVLTRPVPSYAYLPYAFGTDWVESVIINGRRC
jgi:imidazolonepropionase